jgi:hypothetical protein
MLKTKRAYSHDSSRKPGRFRSSSNYRSSEEIRCKSGQQESLVNKNKRLDAQTVWARRCVKKHTRRCRGHFRLHPNSRGEKDLYVEGKSETEQSANDSGRISNDCLKQLSVCTATSDNSNKTGSEVKTSPFTGTNSVSTTCIRLLKLKQTFDMHVF